MPGPGGTTKEHRQFERRLVLVPVSVSTDERRERVGVIRDMSASGMLLHSRSRFAIGERVQLQFGVDRERDGEACGRVVRAGTDHENNYLFPFLTAIQFDAPIDRLPRHA